MRSPPLGDASGVRSWVVQDVAVPMPFNIGASDLNSKKLWQSPDSLSEELFTIRKHQAFRAVSSAALFKDNAGMVPDNYTNTRLIGRSVWNSKWKLVIPGRSLLNDPDEGLDRLYRPLTTSDSLPNLLVLIIDIYGNQDFTNENEINDQTAVSGACYPVMVDAFPLALTTFYGMRDEFDVL